MLVVSFQEADLGFYQVATQVPLQKFQRLHCKGRSPTDLLLMIPFVYYCTITQFVLLHLNPILHREAQ